MLSTSPHAPVHPVWVYLTVGKYDRQSLLYSLSRWRAGETSEITSAWARLMQVLMQVTQLVSCSICVFYKLQLRSGPMNRTMHLIAMCSPIKRAMRNVFVQHLTRANAARRVMV